MIDFFREVIDLPSFKKSTNELLNALLKSASVKNYIQENKTELIDISLSEYLNAVVAEKKLKISQILKDAQINQIYGYQIFQGKKHPSRDKLISIAISMNLELEDIQKMLKALKYQPLYARIARDCVIIKGITDKDSVCKINEELYNNGFDTL